MNQLFIGKYGKYGKVSMNYLYWMLDMKMTLQDPCFDLDVRNMYRNSTRTDVC